MIATHQSPAKQDTGNRDAQPLRFRIISAICVLIGLYHVAALSIPAFARMAYPVEYPPARHLIFIAIVWAFAYLFLRRPRWLIWPSLALTAQVVYGHGMYAWRHLAQSKGIEWVHIRECTFFALASLAALYFDRRAGVMK